MSVIHSPVGAIVVTMFRTFSADDDTLTVVVSGTGVCAADIRLLVEDIERETSKHGLLQVMCDATGMEHTLNHLEVLALAKHAVSVVPVGGRLAIVYARDDREKASFMETVMVHLGKSMRVFSSAAAANAWLGAS